MNPVTQERRAAKKGVGTLVPIWVNRAPDRSDKIRREAAARPKKMTATLLYHISRICIEEVLSSYIQLMGWGNDGMPSSVFFHLFSSLFFYPPLFFPSFFLPGWSPPPPALRPSFTKLLRAARSSSPPPPPPTPLGGREKTRTTTILPTQLPFHPSVQPFPPLRPPPPPLPSQKLLVKNHYRATTTYYSTTP
jgi:hypothetical protein